MILIDCNKCPTLRVGVGSQETTHKWKQNRHRTSLYLLLNFSWPKISASLLWKHHMPLKKGFNDELLLLCSMQII